MSEIAEKLIEASQHNCHEHYKGQDEPVCNAGLLKQAADEIDRLTAELAAEKQRAERAEKICVAAARYVRYGDSPVAIGWEELISALSDWRGLDDALNGRR